MKYNDITFQIVASKEEDKKAEEKKSKEDMKVT